jgi:hypothetical protein
MGALPHISGRFYILLGISVCFSAPDRGRKVTMSNLEAYSVPVESQKLFREGILENPLIKKCLPAGVEKYSDKVKYVGSEKPSIPINWRFAESISALKGLEATLLNALLVKKYGVEAQEVVIST